MAVFSANIQELATAYCEKLPVKIIVLNNQHLGMVVQWEDRFYQSNCPYLPGPIDQRSEAQGRARLCFPSRSIPTLSTAACQAARQIRRG